MVWRALVEIRKRFGHIWVQRESRDRDAETPDLSPGDNVEAVAYYSRQAFHIIPTSLEYILINATLKFNTGEPDLRIQSSLLPPGSAVSDEDKTLEPPPDVRLANVMLSGVLVFAKGPDFIFIVEELPGTTMFEEHQG